MKNHIAYFSKDCNDKMRKLIMLHMHFSLVALEAKPKTYFLRSYMYIRFTLAQLSRRFNWKKYI